MDVTFEQRRTTIFDMETGGGGQGTVKIEEVNRSEGAEIVDDAARRLLSMSGDDFLKRWDAGEEIAGDHVAIMKVAMLLPLAR